MFDFLLSTQKSIESETTEAEKNDKESESTCGNEIETPINPFPTRYLFCTYFDFEASYLPL